jgi:hypothetical protein
MEPELEDLRSGSLGRPAEARVAPGMPDQSANIPQAAAMLNVSEEYLIGLLDAGVIESRVERYVFTRSLLEYKLADDTRRRAALDALSAETDELAHQEDR